MENKATILYVDDEEINLHLFDIYLSKKYTVVTAIDALQGMKLLEENNAIKVVVSDIRMPRMNGIEFLKKANEKYPQIHYFIATGYEINDEIQDAINAGLLRKYFRKPFNMPEIDAAIAESLIKE